MNFDIKQLPEQEQKNTNIIINSKIISFESYSVETETY